MKVLTRVILQWGVIVGLAISCGAAAAQAVTPLSLEAAIELAVTGNRQLQAARYGTEAAIGGVGQARGGFLPRLDIVEAFDYSDKPTLVFSHLLDQASFKQRNFAIGALNQPTPLSNLSSQIRLEQPLYTGGRLSAVLAQAEAAAQASRESTQRTEQEVVVVAIEAYYQVLLAEENLRVVDKALAAARAQLARSQDLYDKGLAVRADYLRTQVLLGSLERERLEAEAFVTINRARLRQHLGADDAEFRLTDKVREDSEPLDDLANLKARAQQQRPDLKAAEKNVERAQESVRAARAGHYPTLGVIAQFESNTRKFSSSGESFAVFLNARWNLFNGFVTQAKIVEEQALHKRAQRLHEDLARGADVEVEKVYLGLVAARRQVGVAEANVGQAEEALRITTDRYGVGLSSNVDVLDGQTALKRAEQDLLLARVNSQILRARLKLATGERP